MDNDILALKAELKAVKNSLRSGSLHRGFTQAGPLQEYFLELHEKENRWLANQLEANGASQLSAKAMPQLRACPQPPPPFDKSSVASVVDHAHCCEADAQECAKALRALSSLAYSSTSEVIADERVISQLVKLMDAHFDVEAVQLGAVGTLCNIAYDPAAAVGRLAEPSVLVSLVRAMSRSGSPAQGTVSKAREAVARIVGAGGGDATGDALGDETAHTPSLQLRKLFSAVLQHGDCAFPKHIVPICGQLIVNEVVSHASIARSCMTASECATESPTAAACWLELVRCLSGDKGIRSEQQEALVSQGAINRVVGVMSIFTSDVPVQLGGIEGCSTLVGIMTEALDSFASAAGARQIEAALRDHPGNLAVQIKGLKALGNCPVWPSPVQVKSGYSWANAVNIAKTAMVRYPRDEELQTVALEVLAKCLEFLPCVREVSADGAKELVEAAMAEHTSAKLQSLGRQVLNSIGY